MFHLWLLSFAKIVVKLWVVQIFARGEQQRANPIAVVNPPK